MWLFGSTFSLTKDTYRLRKSGYEILTDIQGLQLEHGTNIGGYRFQPVSAEVENLETLEVKEDSRKDEELISEEVKIGQISHGAKFQRKFLESVFLEI